MNTHLIKTKINNLNCNIKIDTTHLYSQTKFTYQNLKICIKNKIKQNIAKNVL